jgi:RimJ/RimL family protein N-acetyltransferase
MDSARLVGRPLTADDLAFVMRVWNDERIAPTIGGARSELQLRERIDGWARHREVHGFGAILFHDRATGVPIGWGGLQRARIGIGECLTVGYVIAPELWGRGYATEIATAAIAHAFGTLDADRVYASILSTNGASRRVAEKAGLGLDAEVDHGDHVEVIYVVAREQTGR